MSAYPTVEHEIAAKKIVELCSRDRQVMSILLIGSCARGKASKDSCLDVVLLVSEKTEISRVREHFERLFQRIPEIVQLREAGKYSQVDLIVSDGKIEAQERDWTSGPDEFELEIGNFFVYSDVLFDREKYFDTMKQPYLPFYAETLREQRLAQVKMYMYNNLDHIPLYVQRGLFFNSFSRLYNASKEFLQALFISKKVYPISYDKWIKEQLVEVLKEPKLYREFVKLSEIKNLESEELIQKADQLRTLAQQHLD
ncbi:MAG: nucleotidyltransferase domain-containing protein [Candidatus Hodarchaeota archaeon]